MHYMQDNVGIISICLVTVPVPVGRFDMQLNGAYQNCIVNFYTRIQEVRARIGIQLAWVQDLKRLVGSSLQLGTIKILELPDILQQFFGHTEKYEKSKTRTATRSALPD